ncbi:hypothetical protein D3C77_445390 [compost metagenome]
MPIVWVTGKAPLGPTQQLAQGFEQCCPAGSVQQQRHQPPLERGATIEGLQPGLPQQLIQAVEKNGRLVAGQQGLQLFQPPSAQPVGQCLQGGLRQVRALADGKPVQPLQRPLNHRTGFGIRAQAVRQQGLFERHALSPGLGLSQRLFQGFQRQGKHIRKRRLRT